MTSNGDIKAKNKTFSVLTSYPCLILQCSPILKGSKIFPPNLQISS